MAAVGFLGIRALVSYWRRKEEAESMPLMLPVMPRNQRPINDPFPIQTDRTFSPQPSAVESNHDEESGVVRVAKPPEGTLQLLPGRFEIVSGTDRKKEIRFVKPPGAAVVTFGRDPGAGHTHIQVDSPTVSRMHASMRFETGRWHIKNLSATNPVIVNGQPLPADDEQQLNDSDQVEMGDVIFRFRSR
ncbi:MAG: FHA domain-containing protein [Gemmatimonadota bacterium]